LVPPPLAADFNISINISALSLPPFLEPDAICDAMKPGGPPGPNLTSLIRKQKIKLKMSRHCYFNNNKRSRSIKYTEQ
jgi:hypothetical protein